MCAALDTAVTSDPLNRRSEQNSAFLAHQREAGLVIAEEEKQVWKLTRVHSSRPSGGTDVFLSPSVGQPGTRRTKEALPNASLLSLIRTKSNRFVSRATIGKHCLWSHDPLPHTKQRHSG